MLLPLAFDDPFASAAMDPALQAIEFIERGLLRLFQFLIGGGRFIQHALQLRGLLKSCQQELVAVGKIGGKLLGVIHVTSCYNQLANR